MTETILDILTEIAKNRGMVRDHCLLSLPIKQTSLEDREITQNENIPSEFKTVEGHRLNQWEYERIKRLLEQGLSLRATQKALRVDNIHVSIGTLSKIKKTLKERIELSTE